MAVTEGTLGAMKARISEELARTSSIPADSPIIARAISDAIKIYQKDRFRFNSSDPMDPVTFNTVPGRYAYGAADNPNIETAQYFDYLNITIISTVTPLWRVPPEEIWTALQIGTNSGQPTSWAYENDKIIFYPCPDVAYPITIGGHIIYPEPADDNVTGNKWMTAAERLIRSRAKYQIALHNTRNPQMQEDMSPMQPPPGKANGHESWRAWRELIGEANKVRGVGRIRAMKW